VNCNIVNILFAEETWRLRSKIDGAEYNSSDFYLNGIATMPYPSNHVLIWGSVLLHRYCILYSSFSPRQGLKWKIRIGECFKP